MGGRVRRGAGSPPGEGDVLGQLEAEGLTEVHGYDDRPDGRYPSHVHEFDKVLVCLRGGVTFTTAAGELVLRAGDRLDLDRGTAHSAVVDPAGVRLVEGHGTGPAVR